MPWEYASDSENKSGSLSQLSTLVKKERKENPNTILVDAGDSIQDNLVETFNKGPKQPMVIGMNKMNYDVWEMGNHEFNFGLDTLKHVTSQFKGKILAGNVYNKDGSRFMDSYTIIERDGIKIGIIGMDTPMIAKFEKPNNIKGIEFKDPVAETKKAINELKGKVDAIVGVMHMGLDNENGIKDTGVRDIANACPELDAIIAGHMHVLVENQNVNSVVITEPFKYGKALSKIDLTFKKEKGKNILENKKASTISVSNVESDKEIDEILKPFHEKLRKDANVKIGEVKENNMVDSEEIKGIPTIHMEYNPLISLFHEVGKYYSKADVISLSMDNDDAHLNVGPIKKKDIAYNYRYTGGEITVFELTGKDLKKYMNWAVGYFNTMKNGDITPSFNIKRRASKYNTDDMFGGVKYTIDLTKEEGNRIKDVKYFNGKEVKDSDIIKLGMNSYRMDQLTGKDGILEGSKFKKLWDSKTAFGEDDGTVRNLTIKYIETVKKGVITPKKEDNIKFVGIDKTSENYKKAKELINSGKLKLHYSPDGKYSNIKSITISDLENFNKDNKSDTYKWVNENNNWYYVDNSSKNEKTKGWKIINGKWYYLNPQDGAMKIGWIKDNNKWYNLNSLGEMRTGRIMNNTNWYYLDSFGVMKTGWIIDNNNWYYLDDLGAMKTGWIKYNNNWYYLNNSGVMATDGIVDRWTIYRNGIASL